MTEPRPRIGLVLGAGGAAGAAYHAGALAALHHDLGWDARTADVIVGTSAGSLTGALLRFGVAPDDLAALAVEGTVRHTDDDLIARIREPAEFPSVSMRHFLRLPRRPHPRLVLRLWDPRVRLSALGAFSTLLANGYQELTSRLEFVDQQFPRGWPNDALWVCTARQHDARRVVFGRADRTTRLSLALSASCAVPGYFAPVEIDGERHVDGGIHSPTNADVLLREALDLVVVISPMSGVFAANPVDRFVRRRSTRTLEREVARLRAARKSVLVIQPGPSVVPHLGLDFVRTAGTVDIAREAFLDTGRQLVDLPIRQEESLRAVCARRDLNPHTLAGTGT